MRCFTEDRVRNQNIRNELATCALMQLIEEVKNKSKVPVLMMKRGTLPVEVFAVDPEEGESLTGSGHRGR